VQDQTRSGDTVDGAIAQDGLIYGPRRGTEGRRYTISKMLSFRSWLRPLARLVENAPHVAVGLVGTGGCSSRPRSPRRRGMQQPRRRGTFLGREKVRCSGTELRPMNLLRRVHNPDPGTSAKPLPPLSWCWWSRPAISPGPVGRSCWVEELKTASSAIFRSRRYTGLKICGTRPSASHNCFRAWRASSDRPKSTRALPGLVSSLSQSAFQHAPGTGHPAESETRLDNLIWGLLPEETPIGFSAAARDSRVQTGTFSASPFAIDAAQHRAQSSGSPSRATSRFHPGTFRHLRNSFLPPPRARGFDLRLRQMQRSPTSGVGGALSPASGVAVSSTVSNASPKLVSNIVCPSIP